MKKEVGSKRPQQLRRRGLARHAHDSVDGEEEEEEGEEDEVTSGEGDGEDEEEGAMAGVVVAAAAPPSSACLSSACVCLHAALCSGQSAFWQAALQYDTRRQPPHSSSFGGAPSAFFVSSWALSSSPVLLMHAADWHCASDGGAADVRGREAVSDASDAAAPSAAASCSFSCALSSAVFLRCSLEPRLSVFRSSATPSKRLSSAVFSTFIDSLFAALLAASLRWPSFDFLFLPRFVVYADAIAASGGGEGRKGRSGEGRTKWLGEGERRITQTTPGRAHIITRTGRAEVHCWRGRA